MKKDALIEIKGKYSSDNGVDSIELTTLGSFTNLNGKYYITYREQNDQSDATVTTVTVDGDNRVTLSRRGEITSRMLLEKGKRHLFHYKTSFAEFMLGIFANKISNSLNDDGGKLNFSYTLDINSGLISENEIEINIKEANICRQ